MLNFPENMSQRSKLHLKLMRLMTYCNCLLGIVAAGCGLCELGCGCHFSYLINFILKGRVQGWESGQTGGKNTDYGGSGSERFHSRAMMGRANSCFF